MGRKEESDSCFLLLVVKTLNQRNRKLIEPEKGPRELEIAAKKDFNKNGRD